MHDGRGVDEGPDQLVHPILTPHVAVGEADLSTDGRGTVTDPRLVDQARDLVSRGVIESAQPCSERLDLSAKAPIPLRGMGVEIMKMGSLL